MFSPTVMSRPDTIKIKKIEKIKMVNHIKMIEHIKKIEHFNKFESKHLNVTQIDIRGKTSL